MADQTQTSVPELRNTFEEVNSLLSSFTSKFKTLKPEDTVHAVGSVQEMLSGLKSFARELQNPSGIDQRSIDKGMNSIQKIPEAMDKFAGMTSMLVDSSSSIEAMVKSMGLGKYGEPEYVGLDGTKISAKAYELLPEDKKSEYSIEPKNTDSTVENLGLMTNYVSNVVKSVSKVTKIDTKEIRQSSKRIRQISKAVPEALLEMKGMIEAINGSLGDSEKIRRLIGWNPGNGESEFVKVTREIEDVGGRKVEVEQYLEAQSDWGSEKVKNINYVKPHYEAETGLFLISDYVNKVVDSVNKITDLDPSSVLKKSIKFRSAIGPLVGMLKMTVEQLAKKLGDAKIDPETIKYLVGSETTQDRYQELVESTYRTGETAASETNKKGHSTEKTTEKSAGLLDVTVRVFEVIDKIVNFPIKDNLKKLIKFNVASGLLGIMVNSAVESLMSPVVQLKSSTDKIAKDGSVRDGSNEIINTLGKEGLLGIYDALLKVADTYDKINRRLGILAKRKGAKIESFTNSLVETAVKIGKLEYTAQDGTTAQLSQTDVKNAAANAKSMSAAMQALVPAALWYSLLSIVAIGVRKDKENKVAILTGRITEAVSAVGDKTEDLKNSGKAVVYLAAAVLVMVGVAYLVSQIAAGGKAKDIGTGMAAMAAVSFGSVNIFEKLSDKISVIEDGAKVLLVIAGTFLLFSTSMLILGLANKPAIESLVGFAGMVMFSLVVLWAVNKINMDGVDEKSGLPKSCMALLVIAGSFIMFSLSILLLGLSNDLAWETLGQFALIVAMALGILWLLSKFKSDVVKGALSMLLMGAAFLVFSGVVAVLAMVAETADIGATFAVVGMIAALIGIGVLAGLAAALLGLGSIGIVLLSVALIGMSVALLVLIGVSKLMGDEKDTIDPVIDAIAQIIKKLSKISVLSVIAATLTAMFSVLMLASMVLVCLLLRAVEAAAPEREEMERVSAAMRGISKALYIVSDELSNIGLTRIIGATIVSAFALLMLVSLSVIALILLGFSRMRIATEFDNDNKPIAWESLNGSSFDRVGNTMNNMVKALNVIADSLLKMGVIKTGKAMTVAVEALGMVAAVSGIMALLIKIGNNRIPVEWNSKNEPVAWETLDSKFISKAQATTKLLVDAISGIADQIGSYDPDKMKTAVKNAKKLKKITNCVGSMLNLIIKLTSGPISYGEVDEEGELIPGTHGKIEGSLGDYISSHSKQITKNISSLISVFNDIARQVASDDGIGAIKPKTLRVAKRNMKTVGKIVGVLDPAISLIQNLSSGEYEIKDDDGNTIEKVNLGTFLQKNSGKVKGNVNAVIDMLQGVAKHAIKAFAAGEDNKDDYISGSALRKSKRKIGLVGKILDTLNPAMELIQNLSSGEFTVIVTDEEGKATGETFKANLGTYLSESSRLVKTNVNALIDFVKEIAVSAAVLGKDGNSSRKDVKKGAKKASMVNTVIDTLTGTIELIQELASGQIQTGTDESGNPTYTSLSDFLRDSEKNISNSIDTLVNFLTGEGGLQSKLDKLTGTKGKEADAKSRSIGLVKDMSDVISKIIDMTVKLGTTIDDTKTKDLFGTDEKTNLKGRLGRLMEGFSTPLEDSAVFAKQSAFNTRFMNLSKYEALMKKIMDVKNVSNYEKSVAATEKMVNSINSVNDLKIDKLNSLLKNMVKFGETMEEAVGDVLDKVVELAEELHYIIEANEKKNSIASDKTTSDTSKKVAGQNQNNAYPTVQQAKVDLGNIESNLETIKTFVENIKNNISIDKIGS